MKQIKWALLATFCILPLISTEVLHPRYSLSPKSGKASKLNKSYYNDNKIQQGFQDVGFELVEPYKSLVQITVRQVLTQANVSRYIDTEYALGIINEVGFKLSKPVTLIKVCEVALLGGAALFGAMFLFPKIPKQLEKIWRDPAYALNLDRYFPNGLSDRTLISALSIKTDELLKKIGLKENACKRQVLCYLGDTAKSRLPRIPEGTARFASNFKLGLADNQYLKAFMSGYVEQDCSIINTEASSHNCLVEVIDNFLSYMKQFRSDLVDLK